MFFATLFPSPAASRHQGALRVVGEDVEEGAVAEEDGCVWGADRDPGPAAGKEHPHHHHTLYGGGGEERYKIMIWEYM